MSGLSHKKYIYTSRHLLFDENSFPFQSIPYVSLNAGTTCDQSYSPVTQSVRSAQNSFVQPHGVPFSPNSVFPPSQNTNTSFTAILTGPEGSSFLSPVQGTLSAVIPFTINNEKNYFDTNLNLSNAIDCHSDLGLKLEARTQSEELETGPIIM